MSKKYVVAEGFAFTSGGIILNEGDEITAENFGGNEDVFKAAIADKKIVESSELADEKKEDDKSSGKNPLEKLNKKELEDLAAKLNLETEGKKKEEIFASVKSFIGEYISKSAEASDEQIKEFAVIFGVEVEGKTKAEIVAALNELQK
ncbi:hypothetical protein HMPREF9723_00450 [Treponema denticola OTK]|uniref:Uncharacterized protein n=1 Tax=Treponema denticola OTK TaxID=999434 RepID=A0A0F6MPZ3_TREDN|nr:hypothetical protein [Treponema denticola]EMB23312.1 hypothetical protein HMPREF9723_00450 [Treponema denticola OTK]